VFTATNAPGFRVDAATIRATGHIGTVRKMRQYAQDWGMASCRPRSCSLPTSWLRSAVLESMNRLLCLSSREWTLKFTQPIGSNEAITSSLTVMPPAAILSTELREMPTSDYKSALSEVSAPMLALYVQISLTISNELKVRSSDPTAERFLIKSRGPL
jgi:hypothetical protein